MKLNRFGIVAGLAGMLCLSSGSLTAQDTPAPATAPAPGGGPGRGGRGNFDPEQMRQRMMDRYREQLEIKDDAEWKLISERIEKVSEARREAGGFGGFGGRGGRPPGGGDANTPRRGGFGGDTSPEGEELQKAIEAKASADELKAKMAKLRDARKAKEAKLEKAQDDLRKLLTTRQEAAAVLANLLK